MTPQNLPPNAKRPRRASRAVLLGAAAMIAVGGMFGAAHVVPFSAAQAQNNAPAAEITMPSFANVIERVRGAVVSVKVASVSAADEGGSVPDFRRRMPGGDGSDTLERFFRQFRGEGAPMPRGRAPRRMSQGSGFIISADGYVVTNNHVVRNAVEVTLTLDDGKTVAASVVGTDDKTDLALLKIKDAGTYKYVSFADTLPRVGDWVVAIGNPFGLGGTVTAGIVSARGRDIGAGPYDDFLQIDAPVNRGNSGGPTFDARGNVVGVNTAIYSPSGGSVGIGFAIPATVAKTVVASLRDNGTVSRGYLGVQIQPVTKDIAESLGLGEPKGALIAEAQPDTPAARAGLRSGDVIVAVNGERVDSPRELSRKIASLGPQKKVDVTYSRDGSEKTVGVTLSVQPNSRASARNDDRGSRREFGSRQNDAGGERYGMTLAPAASVAGAGAEGVVVAEIEPDGRAARQGIRSGDIILEAAGKKVSTPADVSRAIAEARSNGRQAVLLRLKSGDSTRFVALATQRS